MKIAADGAVELSLKLQVVSSPVLVGYLCGEKSPTIVGGGAAEDAARNNWDVSERHWSREIVDVMRASRDVYRGRGKVDGGRFMAVSDSRESSQKGEDNRWSQVTTVNVSIETNCIPGVPATTDPNIPVLNCRFSMPLSELFLPFPNDGALPLGQNKLAITSSIDVASGSPEQWTIVRHRRNPEEGDHLR